MMEEEIRKMKLRLTQLEISNARLAMVVIGTAEITQHAQQSAMECGECGKDITKINHCTEEVCDWGFPKEAPAEVVDEQT